MHVCRVWRNMAIANCWLCQSWELKNGPPQHRVQLHVRIRVRVLASASQSNGVLSKEQQNANIIEWNIIYVLHLQSAARQQFSSRTHMLHAPHVPRKLPYTCTGRNDPSSTLPLLLLLLVIWGPFAYGMPLPTVAAAVSNSPVAFSLFFCTARFSGKVAPSTHKYLLVSSWTLSLAPPPPFSLSVCFSFFVFAKLNR